MECQSAPLLTFWPSAFPPACLGCGRTLLAAVLALASLVVLSGGNALAQGNVATTDREALVALYDATDGSNWTTSTNWKTTAPLKDWSGVTAPAGDSVIILSLVYNNLSGIIPAQLGDLTNLRILRLADNQLTGSIPATLSNLTNLSSLFLADNQLTGSIPPELGNLTNLWILYLSNNQLSGSIPAQLGDLTNLRILFLGSNQLSGSIPAQLGDLTNLTGLLLGSNQLSGSIPATLGNLTNLTSLWLFSNQLSGSIPAQLGDLTNLTGLLLGSNQLTGSIPPELGNLTNLTQLWLFNNQLSGSIPAQLGDLTNLSSLFLGNNQLTGSIPPELGNLTNLTRLVLDNNQLTGSIPVELGNLSNLTQLALDTDTGLCLAHDFLLTSFFATESGLSVCTEVFTLDFAHFANGDDITSDLVFVNLSTERSRPAPTPFHSDILPTRPVLYFYGTEGQPIAAESVVDITGDLEVMEDGGLTVRTEMEPLGVLTISTHGRGELVSGSVKVVADEPIGGGLRFDLPEIGVAGVGVSSPISDAVFPVRRQEGGINTGVAIHNQGEEVMVARCRLMSNGIVLEEVEIPLEANGQASFFIDEQFPDTDTSGFVGSVRCTAPGEGLFTGVAVELDAANRIFTTLPVVPVDSMAAQDQEGVLDFAHFANGGAIVSDLVFINAGTAPTQPVISFYDQAGETIAAESVVDVLGGLVVREDGALSVQTEMEPLGELTISTHGRGDLVTGSVKVVSDGPIGGVLRFDLPGIGVAGVGASQPIHDAIFPARRQAGGINTAAALHNLGEEAIVVTCRLMSAGAALEEVEIPLAANRQEARFIDEVFTRTDTSDFVGSVRCTAPEEGLFTGVAVELDAVNRIFTTLPVVPVPERMSQE